MYLDQDSEQMRKPLDRMSTSVSLGPGGINIQQIKLEERYNHPDCPRGVARCLPKLPRASMGTEHQEFHAKLHGNQISQSLTQNSNSLSTMQMCNNHSVPTT